MKGIARTVARLVVLVVAGSVVLFAYNVATHYRLAGPTEPVSFENGDLRFSGALIKPAEDGVFPGVVMLLGSGPEDRDGPGYRINANNLVRHGFAVLLYDKRGSGESDGDFDTTTYEDMAADASAALRYLAGRGDIDGERIGLFTNSESGWFSAQVALQTPGVDFIINRVGPPLPWMDTVLWEVRNEFLGAGVAESDLEPLLDITRKRWLYYQAAGNDPSLAAGPMPDALNAELRRLRETVPLADQVLPEKVADYDPDFYRTFAARSAYDPDIYLRQIDVPLLYVFGEADVNVPTTDSVAYLRTLSDDYPAQIDMLIYPGLGHALFTWSGLINGGYPRGYLEYTGRWAARQVAP